MVYYPANFSSLKMNYERSRIFVYRTNQKLSLSLVMRRRSTIWAKGFLSLFFIHTSRTFYLRNVLCMSSSRWLFMNFNLIARGKHFTLVKLYPQAPLRKQLHGRSTVDGGAQPRGRGSHLAIDLGTVTLFIKVLPIVFIAWTLMIHENPLIIIPYGESFIWSREYPSLQWTDGRSHSGESGPVDPFPLLRFLEGSLLSIFAMYP